MMLLVGLASPAPAAAKRAIWVWEQETFRMLDDARYRNGVTAFFTEKKIGTIYLYADSFRGRNILVDEPEKYRRYIAQMHSCGFEVYALLGSMYLKTQEYILPEKRAAAVLMFENVLRYNAAADTASRFDGANIDIEPYLLSDWGSQKTLRATQYLSLSTEFMRMNRKAGGALIMGPAMPFWWDGIEISYLGKRKKLSEHTQDIYDYVSIMDYRNFAAGGDGIISHASDELDYADAIGRKVVIGVETLKSDPPKVTFFGKGLAVMERELAIAEAALARHPSFSGFAIHHLRSYRSLRR